MGQERWDVKDREVDGDDGRCMRWSRSIPGRNRCRRRRMRTATKSSVSSHNETRNKLNQGKMMCRKFRCAQIQLLRNAKQRVKSDVPPSTTNTP